MESPDRESSDAVGKSAPPSVDELHKRLLKMEKMVEDFRIVGGGFHGSFQKGYAVTDEVSTDESGG